MTFDLPNNALSLRAGMARTSARLADLRSHEADASAPTDPVGGMLWAGGTLQVYGRETLAWHEVTRWIEKLDERAWSAAAFTAFAMSPPVDAFLERVRIVSTTATTGSSAGVTDYEVDVWSVTAGATLLDEPYSTGDAELAANTPKDLVPTSLSALDAGTVVELRVTVNGTPTSLDRVAVWASWTAAID